MPTNSGYQGPFVDAHIHLWNSRSTPRVVTPLVKALGWSPSVLNWIVPKVFPKNALSFVGSPKYTLGNYLPEDWQMDTDSDAVSSSGYVHIEASWKGKSALNAPDETAWLESVCDERLLGIVGHADLANPKLDDILAGHKKHSARFRGVRDKLAFSKNSAVMPWCTGNEMTDSAWRQGYAKLGESGLTFDAWCYGDQLPMLTNVVKEYPKTKVVLDHLGTPVGAGGRYPNVVTSEKEREQVFAKWKDDLAHLAEQKHVYAKLSGLTMPVLGFGFHEWGMAPSLTELADKLGPFIEHALEVFSPQRCFFASNFPMDKVSVTWGTLFAVYDQLSRNLGNDVQLQLFSKNAAAFYSLPSSSN